MVFGTPGSIVPSQIRSPLLASLAEDVAFRFLVRGEIVPATFDGERTSGLEASPFFNAFVSLFNEMHPPLGREEIFIPVVKENVMAPLAPRVFDEFVYRNHIAFLAFLGIGRLGLFTVETDPGFTFPFVSRFTHPPMEALARTHRPFAISSQDLPALGARLAIVISHRYVVLTFHKPPLLERSFASQVFIRGRWGEPPMMVL